MHPKCNFADGVNLEVMEMENFELVAVFVLNTVEKMAGVGVKKRWLVEGAGVYCL